MGYDKKQLKELMKPLYDFRGKRIKPVRVITLPVSFGTPKNPRTEYITFDVVGMLYLYNAIFGRGLLNLCFKVLATFGIIMTFGSQKEARSINHGFTPVHKNVHFLREDAQQHEQVQPPSKQKVSMEFKKAIEVKGGFKRVPLDPMIPDRAIGISTDMNPQEQMELLQFLDKSSDDFAWSTSDLVGVSREVIEHKLQVNPCAKSKQ
jgi:hypothetical protein